MAENKIYPIKLSDIEIGDINVRKSHQDEGISELANSIAKHGLLQPIVLKGKFESAKPYEIIVGQRRFLAHQVLGRETINATFSGEISDIQAHIISLAENMQRVELNHADKANSITELFIHFSRNERKVANALGLNIRTIRDYIKLEEQSTPKAKRYLKENKISKADLKRVIDAAAGAKSKIDELIDIIGSLTKYEKNRLVQYGKDNPKKNVSEMVEEAKKPKIEETIILNLPINITQAVRKASIDLSLDLETLSLNVLTYWLKDNNYL